MLAYLKRHHVALLALFIALGGTSYAAVSLPRNSVGKAQLRPRAVTESKLSRGVRTKLDAAGPKGDTGTAGPKGDPGPQGIQGLKGDPGPTSAGVGGFNTTVVVGGFTGTLGSPASVTLDRPGKVLVQLIGTFSVGCGGAPCNRTLGVTLDGETVPGAFATLSGGASQDVVRTVNATGIISGVAAGTHNVSIADKMGGSVSGFGNGGDVRVVAIALGE